MQPASPHIVPDVAGPGGEPGVLLRLPRGEALDWDVRSEIASTARHWMDDREGWWIAAAYLATAEDIAVRHAQPPAPSAPARPPASPEPPPATETSAAAAPRGPEPPRAPPPPPGSRRDGAGPGGALRALLGALRAGARGLLRRGP